MNKLVGCVGYVFSNETGRGEDSTRAMLQFSSQLMGELYTREHNQRMQELILAAMDNTDEGIIITQRGKNWREAPILLANRGAARLVGVHPREMTHRSISEFISDSGGKPDRACCSVDDEHPKKWKQQYQLRDGKSFLGECSLYPIREGESSIRRFLCILRDVTEREEIESRLAFVNKMETIGQLSAGIAHEINTPSQFISDNLLYLQEAWNGIEAIVRKQAQCSEGDDTEQAQRKRIDELLEDTPEAISDALEGIDRVSKIVKAMRDFSHPGKRFTFANINDCISTTVTVARNEWKYVSDLTLDLDPEIPPIRMLPGEINQVLLNLIVNAAHAIADRIGNKAEKGAICISTKTVGDSVRTSISDNGNGMPESVLKKIYDPFFTTKEVGKGTGQGLFMAHATIEQKHRGKLWCDTKPGEGTTFYFDLPINLEESNEPKN